MLIIVEADDGHVRADDSLLFTLVYVWRKVFNPAGQTENHDGNRELEKAEVLGCLDTSTPEQQQIIQLRIRE